MGRHAEHVEAPTRWPVVALAIVAGMTAALHVGKAPPAVPIIRGEMGLDLVEAGWIVAVIAFTGAATGIFAGVLSDRAGHRRMLLAGLVLLLLGDVGGAAAPGALPLLLSRFVEGVGLVAVVVAAPSLIVQASRAADRRIALGLWSSYMPAGIAVAMIASTLLLPNAGWRPFWLLVAAATLACLAAAAFVLRAVPETRGGFDWAEVTGAVKRRGPWLLALSFLLYTWQWGALMVWLPTVLVEERGLGGGLPAVLTALVVILNVPGNLAGGWLLHRGVPRWVLMLASFALMALLFQVIMAESAPALLRYAACIAFSATSGVLPAAVLAGAPVHAATPRQIGLVNGLLVNGANGGHVVGPPLTAFVATVTGAWSGTAWAMAAAAVLGMILALALRAAERH